MRRKIIFFLFPVLCCILFAFSGCRLKREVQISNHDEINEGCELNTGKVLHVRGNTWNNMTVEGILKYFWNMDRESADSYIVKPYYENAEKNGFTFDEDFFYEKGYEKLHIAKTEDMGIGWLNYRDDKYGRAACYGFYNIHGYLNEGLGSSMATFFPDRELERSNKEDAIKFCRPLAELCGYSGDCVKVFAMTADRMNKICDELRFEWHAPDTGYRQTLTAYETYALLGELEEAEAINDKGRQSEINKLLLQEDKLTDIPWTQKDEAYLLIYQPELNEIPVESYYQMLSIVYVPALKKIVFAEGYTPFNVTGMDDQVLISREQAIFTTVLSLGMEENKAFDVIDSYLAYSVRAIEFSGSDPILHPCWKIDYRYPGMNEKDSGTLLIDAVSGQVSQFSEQG